MRDQDGLTSRDVAAVFELDRVLVVILSGEQIGQGPQEPGDIASGVFAWGASLQSDPQFDVHPFDEDHVDADGAGAVFNFLVGEINSGNARRIAIVGHSHGGGSTHDLCARLASDPGDVINDAAGFEIIMTGYVDAIENNSNNDFNPERRFPPLSQNNVNLYQKYGLVDGYPVSGSIPDWNVNENYLPCVTGQGHGDIDDCPVVHAILTDRLYFNTRGSCYQRDSNYCDDGLECHHN